MKSDLPTWVETVPFVSPDEVQTLQTAGQAAPLRRLERDKNGWLRGGARAYRVVEGVPILLPESSEQSAEESAQRSTFYTHHYSNRSRTADLASGYRKQTREFITEYIRQQGIAGLVLEVGCGTGTFADCSPSYLGMDYSQSSVFAEGFQDYKRFVGDAQCIPLLSESVELVISINTLEHVPDVDLAFREIHRVLKAGGHAMLHPAWNCSVLQTKLIPVRSYSQLDLHGKVLKLLFPVLTSRLWKAFSRIPSRLLTAILHGRRRNLRLKYGKLTPYLGEDIFIADCDACSSIDIFDAIQFFESRGYRCSSHPTFMKKLLSTHAPLIVTKPAIPSNKGEPISA